MDKGKLKKLLISIFVIIIIALIIVFYPRENNKILDMIEEYQIQSEKNDTEVSIEENKNFYTFLDTINNIKDLSSTRINSQIKFISVLDDSYQDLLTCSLTGSAMNRDSKYSCNGILSIDMDNINVNVKFPTYMKNLGTDDYSMMLEVPSIYKRVFGMTDEQLYLKIDATSKEKLSSIFTDMNKTYVEKPEATTNPSLEKIKKDSFKSSLTFTEDINDTSSGIYDICFNQTATKALYKQILENEEYSKDIFISTFFKNLLKDEANISNIYSMKGQIAVSKGIATDIYFEIESQTTSMIAFRITLSEINNAEIEEVEYHSNEIKQFDTFIDTLITDNQPKSTSTEKTIQIGNVYFTGADNTKKIDVFTEDMLNEPINIFINYSKCTPKTNLIIRWYYENQIIQLVENKLNNGDYEDGILKSSITFTDSQSIPKGTYRVEVYIDGQDNCYGKGEFTIE